MTLTFLASKPKLVTCTTIGVNRASRNLRARGESATTASAGIVHSSTPLSSNDRQRQLVTLHENYFYIESISPNVQDIAIEFMDHYISSGQPWGNPSWRFDNPSNVLDRKVTIVIRAGRHKTSEVADWFKSGNLTPWNLCGTDARYGSPSEFNFAAKLHLIVIYKNGTVKTLNDFRLGQGQGHDSNLHNNWWVGHSSCQQQDGSPPNPSQEFVCD